MYSGWLRRPGRPSPADGPSSGERLPAAVSIGTNPQFDGVERRVEAYVLDRDDLDLYGHRVRLELVDRLRPTLRFDDVDALVVQMGRDVDQARAGLAQDAARPLAAAPGGLGPQPAPLLLWATP